MVKGKRRFTCLLDEDLPIPCFAEREDLSHWEQTRGCSFLANGGSKEECPYYDPQGVGPPTWYEDVPPPEKEISRTVDGLKLRALREKEGLSMSKLAERAGLNPHTVFEAEQEKRRTSRRTIVRIARALRVPESEFTVDDS